MRKEVLIESKKDSGIMTARLEDVGFSTYDRALFEQLYLSVKSGDVIALTGKSGSGKTLLIKMLAGMESPQEGKVNVSSSATISYVPQEIEDINISLDTTVRQLFINSRGLDTIGKEMVGLETEISSTPSPSATTLERYGELAERFQALNGYDPEPEMQKFLSGLRVDEHSTGNITLDTRISDVSSGQLKRIMIARALYAMPTLLLLDDPTSHLDTAAVAWLANYLREISSAVVIASNNQDFLDGCVNHTVGLTDNGRVFSFDGNYSDFLAKRDVVVDSEKSEANSVANQLENLQETDRMFRAKQAYRRSSNMAQVGRALGTRMRRLEDRYKSMPGSQDVYDQDKVRDMVFTQEARSGKDVISIRGVIKRYGDFSAVDLSSCDPINVGQGERWLIRGPNGSGKSTLLRMIAQGIHGGDFVPDQGSIAIGTNVDCAYYSPDFINISRTGSIMDEVTVKIGGDDGRKAASVLRFFGFTPSTVLNLDVGMLSSGEKKRLALAKIMLRDHNLLVLDEPTGDYMPNEIKDRLAHALRGYSGTLVLVSHDTYFLDKLHLDFKLNLPEGKVSS